RLVVRDRLRAPTEGRENVRETLADGRNLARRRLGLGQRGERELVVVDGVLVGIETARPVARRHEVPGPLRPVAAQAPVAREGLDVLESRGAAHDHVLEGAARLRVELRPTE